MVIVRTTSCTNPVPLATVRSWPEGGPFFSASCPTRGFVVCGCTRELRSPRRNHQYYGYQLITLWSGCPLLSFILFALLPRSLPKLLRSIRIIIFDLRCVNGGGGVCGDWTARGILSFISMMIHGRVPRGRSMTRWTVKYWDLLLHVRSHYIGNWGTIDRRLRYWIGRHFNTSLWLIVIRGRITRLGRFIFAPTNTNPGNDPSFIFYKIINGWFQSHDAIRTQNWIKE